LKLPFADQAIVPESKIVEYLLSETHPQGRSKAVFFRRLGFAPEEPGRLRAALLDLAASADMTESAAFGMKYVGTGEFVAPSGELVRVTTVWVIGPDSTSPVLVTAYPA